MIFLLLAYCGGVTILGRFRRPYPSTVR